MNTNEAAGVEGEGNYCLMWHDFSSLFFSISRVTSSINKLANFPTYHSSSNVIPMYKNKCSDSKVFFSTGGKITEDLGERESYRNS